MNRDDVIGWIRTLQASADDGTELFGEIFRIIDDDGLRNYLTSVDIGKATFEGYEKSVSKAKAANEKFSVSSQLANVATSVLNGGLAGLANALAGVAFDWAVGKIDEWIHAEEYAAAAANEARDAYKNQMDELGNTRSTIQDISGEYEVLAQGVDSFGRNISLSAEEYERYKEIVQQIAEISPSLVLGYDAENHAIIDKNRLIERSIELQKEQAKTELEKKTSLPNLKTALEGNLGEYNQALGSQAEYSKAYGYDLSLRGLPISLRVCARIILAESLLFLPSIFRILFFYGILAQTRCDIDTSSLCVLDSLCHLVFYFPF